MASIASSRTAEARARLGIGPFALVDGGQDRPGKAVEQHGDESRSHRPVAVMAPVRQDHRALRAQDDPDIAIE